MNTREIVVELFKHLCEHSWHGYSQVSRWGDGEGNCPVNVDGKTYYLEQGDRDCSSAVISAYEAAGVNCGGATNTRNMRKCMTDTGNFEWKPMSYTAQPGDIYLKEGSHTAMCISANPDMLGEFSQSETGGIDGKEGDQTGKESYIHAYYDYPWDGILHFIGDKEMERYELHTFGNDSNGRTLTKCYDNETKKYMRNTWCQIGKLYYYAGNDEFLLMGWQENLDGRKKVYFIAPDWHLHAGWLSFGSRYYFMHSNGDMATGWQTLGGETYYFGTDGVRRTGWQNIDGKKYWFDIESGKLLKGLITFGNDWYYMSHEDGHLMYTDSEGRLY